MGRRKIEHRLVGPREVASAIAAERPDLDPSEYLYLIYMIRLGGILDSIWDQYCRATFEISAGDMRVLLALRRAGAPYALRPTELFRSLLITSGAITKQVDRLSECGLVKRKQSKTTPGLFVHLTGRGLKATDQALTVLADSSKSSLFSTSLSRKEKTALATLCERMLVELESTVATGRRDVPGPALSAQHLQV